MRGEGEVSGTIFEDSNTEATVIVQLVPPGSATKGPTRSSAKQPLVSRTTRIFVSSASRCVSLHRCAIRPGATSASAPVAERIVCVAEVPLRPFWVLTCEHGGRRAAGQRTRLFLPCPSELRQLFVHCGLQDRILESEGMQWSDASPALRSGVCLHSLVLARLGQVRQAASSSRCVKLDCI